MLSNVVKISIIVEYTLSNDRYVLLKCTHMMCSTWYTHKLILGITLWYTHIVMINSKMIYQS